MSTFNWVGKSADGKTITLHQLNFETMFRAPDYFTPEWEAEYQDLVRLGAVIDVETTGLMHDQDKIIEIGVRQFKFNRSTGEILSLEKAYGSLQDPRQEIKPEITALTGITNEMVKGKEIQWAEVDRILTEAQFVIAHNASFDRPFIDELSPASRERVWGCSFQQVDWTLKGLPSQKLEILSIYHGFFNGAHRALNDADSLLYLLSQKDQALGTPYFLELLTQARKSMVSVYATYSPFEAKDLLRARQYRWDSQGKVWSKKIPKEELQFEVRWLEMHVYQGTYKGRHEEISILDQFKAKLR